MEIDRSKLNQLQCIDAKFFNTWNAHLKRIEPITIYNVLYELETYINNEEVTLHVYDKLEYKVFSRSRRNQYIIEVCAILGIDSFIDGIGAKQSVYKKLKHKKHFDGVVFIESYIKNIKELYSEIKENCIFKLQEKRDTNVI